MFEISNGGVYTRHDSSFFMNRPRGFSRHVLLITRTRASFKFGDREFVAGPYQAVLIAPGSSYSYRNPSGAYADDWLHFTGSGEDLDMIDPEAFGRPFPLVNPSLAENCLQQLLYENSYAPAELKAEHIDSLLKILLRHLMYEFRHGTPASYSPYMHPMQRLRLDMQADPRNAGSAKDAARGIGISLSYFQHLYSEFFGISYQKDLIRMKLSLSEELLKTTDLTIEEIARAVGYRTPIHFYRQFMDTHGVTPGQYRS